MISTLSALQLGITLTLKVGSSGLSLPIFVLMSNFHPQVLTMQGTDRSQDNQFYTWKEMNSLKDFVLSITISKRNKMKTNNRKTMVVY